MQTKTEFIKGKLLWCTRQENPRTDISPKLQKEFLQSWYFLTFFDWSSQYDFGRKILTYAVLLIYGITKYIVSIFFKSHLDIKKLLLSCVKFSWSIKNRLFCSFLYGKSAKLWGAEVFRGANVIRYKAGISWHGTVIITGSVEKILQSRTHGWKTPGVSR